MLDLLLDATDVLKDPAWSGIAVAVAILVPVLGFLARVIYVNRTSDLTRDGLRLLKALNEQVKGTRGLTCR
jgi:hypothetical protein